MQEFVKGYHSGDRTIRPARVKVAKKPAIQRSLDKEIKKSIKELTI